MRSYDTLQSAYLNSDGAGRSALRIPSAIIAMALVLMAETMLFAGLVSACLLLRYRSAVPWPPPDQPRLPMLVTHLNTLVLLVSGFVLYQAAHEPLRRYRRVATAMGLGLAFLCVQGVEWSRLLAHRSSTIGGPFAGVFYALIATHALHVVAGLALLLWIYFSPVPNNAARTNNLRLRVCSMYWYFVVAVWPILYALIYF
jgi:heme/copper-type cytochrome/quinol oxidase subunit 3